MSEGTSGVTSALAGLDPLEIATGVSLEPLDRPRPRRPRPDPVPEPRRALERAVLRALSEPGRASISFSGGRDSSLVLAVATHVARREGLELPVPITLRHESEASDETPWQELVIGHLGLSDWVRVDVADSMDMLGPQATTLLERHGVLSPANSYLHLPVMAHAPGSAVLTGVGGDEVLGTPGDRLARVRYARARPRRRDVRRAAVALAPLAVRRREAMRHGHPWWPWLTAQADRAARHRFAQAEARVRVRWDTYVSDLMESRYVRHVRQSAAAVADAYGKVLHDPLLDRDFVHAFASRIGPGGPASRTESLRLLAADLLPQQVIERSSKAAFDALVWGPATRAFLAGWRPDLLPASVAALVEPDVLVAEWAKPAPLATAMMLTQQSWLGSRTP